MLYDPNSRTVIVTYGNAWPNQRWASNIKSPQDARALRQGAISKGFVDATIWIERDFQAFLREKQAGQADSGRADSPRR
jgi:hypothetical protein